MAKTIERQRTKPKTNQKEIKNRPMDFTLCVTVMLLLALRNYYGVVSKFSIGISRITEIVILMYLSKLYLL